MSGVEFVEAGVGVGDALGLDGELEGARSEFLLPGLARRNGEVFEWESLTPDGFIVRDGLGDGIPSRRSIGIG